MHAFSYICRYFGPIAAKCNQHRSTITLTLITLTEMKKLTVIALGSLVALGASAKVALPKFITDNMVVQQNANLTIPGTAEPGAKVTVTADWNGTVSASAKAGKDGRFKVQIPTPKAGGPYTIIVSDGTKGGDAVITNILSGEVWLCSGQSNMEFPVKGWGELPDADRIVAESVRPEIRLLRVKKEMAYTPQEDTNVLYGGWVESAPCYMDFSAIAYLYALQMQKELGVPIGVIDASWGGTPAEAWTSYEGLAQAPGYELTRETLKKYNYDGAKLVEAYPAIVNDWQTYVSSKDLKFDTGKMQKGWGTLSFPGDWESQGVPGHDGTVWVQRELTLPASAAGKPMRLRLGRVDDRDWTYVNGTEVGSVDGAGTPRDYQVPGNLVKAGKNVITVRILDTGGPGGINGKPTDLFASVDGQTYPLDGQWNYSKGIFLPDMPTSPAHPGTTQYPTLLYNSMIAPITVMPVKGVLWYQGCNNVGRAKEYEPLFQALIKDWRRVYNQPDMPFYFVQLAGYLTPSNCQPDSQWALLRNAQAKALTLPNTGMATAIDLGHPTDIHPVNKGEVARRLGLISLNQTYGKKDVVYAAPVCTGSRTEGNKMVLTFSAPVHSVGGSVTGFIIGDARGNFAYASGRLVNPTTVELSSPLVKAPTIARYNWADYPNGNLYGATQLPVTPFATDL